MGQVWLARLLGKHGFEKLVALKVSMLSGDSSHQQMFIDEARIAAAIEHVNVARMLELGEHEDVLYIVMEWVDGDSLSTLLRRLDKVRIPIPLAFALWIVHETCAGAHAAHNLRDAGGRPLEVVHRDISPQNILLARNGGVKLIDFGIAKARSRLTGETTAGTIKGKIKYMAPEQARGGHIDRRADIFSLGAVLYRLLAGRPPFEGENEVATLRLLLTGDPAPPLPDGIRASVVEVVERSLACDPAHRYGTAAEMQSAIARAMLEEGLSANSSELAVFLAAHLRKEQDKRESVINLALRDAGDPGSVPRKVVELLRPAPSERSGMTDASSRSASRTGGPHLSGMYASWPAPQVETVANEGMAPSGRARPLLWAALVLGAIGAILIVMTTSVGARRRAAAGEDARGRPSVAAPSVQLPPVAPSAAAAIGSGAASSDAHMAPSAAPVAAPSAASTSPTPARAVAATAGSSRGAPKPRPNGPTRPSTVTKPSAPDFGY